MAHVGFLALLAGCVIAAVGIRLQRVRPGAAPPETLETRMQNAQSPKPQTTF